MRARITGALRTDCVRCLGPVSIALDEPLDLVYLPPVVSLPGERFLDASDMNVSFYEGDDLELRETIREQMHLALPPKPLCAADCLGLCPFCGADRNAVRNRGEQACRCRAESVSASGGGLGALRDLFAAGQPPR